MRGDFFSTILIVDNLFPTPFCARYEGLRNAMEKTFVSCAVVCCKTIA